MSSGDAWASLRSKPCSAPFLTLIQNAYGGAGGEAVFNPANVGAAAAGGSASSILGIHDMAAANVSATAYANGGSGGSNENGSVAGAAGSTTASTTLVGVGGAFGVSTAIGGGSAADASGVGGRGATATTDVTAPGNATYSIVSAIATAAGDSGGSSSDGAGGEGGAATAASAASSSGSTSVNSSATAQGGTGGGATGPGNAGGGGEPRVGQRRALRPATASFRFRYRRARLPAAVGTAMTELSAARRFHQRHERGQRVDRRAIVSHTGRVWRLRRKYDRRRRGWRGRNGVVRSQRLRQGRVGAERRRRRGWQIRRLDRYRNRGERRRGDRALVTATSAIASSVSGAATASRGDGGVNGAGGLRRRGGAVRPRPPTSGPTAAPAARPRRRLAARVRSQRWFLVSCQEPRQQPCRWRNIAFV
jgi:hypothetical protein